MTETIMQAGEVLEDRSPSGKLRPWGINKMLNSMLAYAYEDIDKKKTVRLRECATVLGFLPTETGKKLRVANFCRVRLCPTCTWRRSLKLQSQMHAIMNAMAADAVNGGKKLAFVYLTLSIKNMTGDKLSGALDKLNLGWKRLMKTETVKNAVEGYFKSLEVTHNVDPQSKSYDTYHPHIHAVLAVSPSYFSGKHYIKQAEWAGMWQKAMRLSYEPNVDVRKVKGNTAKAVAEAAGYGTKSSSFIIPDDWDLTVESVRTLDTALAKRRFVSFGGVMKDYHKRLNLDHIEDGNLVHVDGEKPGEDEYKDRMIYYAWFTGYRQYRRIAPG
jgi:plasmid rolling circle replication initiator protein Rep